MNCISHQACSFTPLVPINTIALIFIILNGNGGLLVSAQQQRIKLPIPNANVGNPVRTQGGGTGGGGGGPNNRDTPNVNMNDKRQRQGQGQGQGQRQGQRQRQGQGQGQGQGQRQGQGQGQGQRQGQGYQNPNRRPGQVLNQRQRNQASYNQYKLRNRDPKNAQMDFASYTKWVKSHPNNHTYENQNWTDSVGGDYKNYSDVEGWNNTGIDYDDYYYVDDNDTDTNYYYVLNDLDKDTLGTSNENNNVGSKKYEE